MPIQFQDRREDEDERRRQQMREAESFDIFGHGIEIGPQHSPPPEE